MITVDAPISFLVGGGIALACKDTDNPGIKDRHRTLYRGMILQSTILSPMILYFMLRFPDWEWNYLFDAQAFFFGNPGPAGYGVLVVIVALINLSFYAGFRLVESLVSSGNEKGAIGLLAGTGALIGLVMAVMYRQTLHLGTLAEFEAGTAPLIFMNVEFLVVQGIAGALLGPAIGWIVWSNRQER